MTILLAYLFGCLMGIIAGAFIMWPEANPMSRHDNKLKMSPEVDAQITNGRKVKK